MHIPYGRQLIDESDQQAVTDCLHSAILTQGPKIEQFADKLKSLTTADYCTLFNSATSALHASCAALGLGKGDVLWTSPISFVASSNCALYCNASVDFVDIDVNTGLISLEHLENKLVVAKRINKLPKILVVVHLAGTSCQMKEIYDLSKKYSFSVIEDASHAIGGYYQTYPVGSCKFSDITVFSFHPVKIITTGEGGAAFTNNHDIAARLATFVSHGIVREGFRYESPGPWYYEQQSLGYNYRMTDIQASLGISQLLKLRDFVISRTKIISFYKSELSDLPLFFSNRTERKYQFISLRDCTTY